MYQKFWNFLRGSVSLTADSPTPERILNLCAVHDIPVWELHWHNAERFSMRTTREGVRRLHKACGQVEVRFTFSGEEGAPKLLRQFRYRYALIAALALFLGLLWLGNTFIWAFEVTGNDTIPTETILRALEKQGVTIGTRGLSIDQDDLRNHLLLELRDISWLTVYMRGCTAHVQVVERDKPPALMKDGDKTNVVASRDGLVTKVEALDGKAMVLPGTTVRKGQLLISGVVDSDFRGMRLLHGMGRVYARTWYELSVSVPLTVQEHTEAEKETTRLSLIFGKQRIKISGRGSILPSECDKMTLYTPMTLPFGFRLPVTLVKERVTRYGQTETQRSASEAREAGEALLLQQLRETMTEDGEVLTTRFAAAEKDGWLLVTLSAECSEQIGEIISMES